MKYRDADAARDLEDGRAITVSFDKKIRGVRYDGNGGYFYSCDTEGDWVRFGDLTWNTFSPAGAVDRLRLEHAALIRASNKDDWWHIPKEVETLQTIKAAPKVAGYNCKKCNEFCEFTEPNQPDGTFVCFGCR